MNHNSLDIHVFKNNKDKIKQPKSCENGVLPRMHCSYLITGKSGSGKTMACLNLLNNKSLLGGAFDLILYFCGSPDDMMKENLKIPKENFLDDSKFSEEYIQKIIDSQKKSVLKKGAHKTKHLLLMFDDILSKQKFLNSKTVVKLVTECRHYNITTIFNSQSYKKINRTIRLNARGLIIFPSSQNELEMFAEENCLPHMTKKHFLSLIQHCTKEPYNFAFLQQDAPVQDRLRKNFATIVN